MKKGKGVADVYLQGNSGWTAISHTSCHYQLFSDVRMMHMNESEGETHSYVQSESTCRILKGKSLNL